MSQQKYRYTFWGELASLLLVAMLFIFPLKYQSALFGMTSDGSVDLYYVLSSVVLATSQIGYMWPIRSFFITSYKAYLIGLGVLVLMIQFWLRRAEAITLDFSELTSGEMFGPVLIAIVLPTIHAFAHIAGTTNRKP